MKTKTSILILLALVSLGLFSLSPDAVAAGEVTKQGNMWKATVDGTVRYTGQYMFEAMQKACDWAGQGGTINVRDSGESDDKYEVRPHTDQILDFHGNTIHCNASHDYVMPIRSDRRNGITVRNLRVTGDPRYGMWFQGASGITLHNITMELSDTNPVGLGIRVDSSTKPAGNLTISGNINISGSNGHGIETYGIDGFNIGDVTVTNTGGCGLLLNDSRNGTVGNVVGDWNCWGGGYATFRVANNNGPNVTVESVYSRNSGRGLFSVSGSYGLTVGDVDIADSWSHGVFLEDTSDTDILNGNVCNGNVQEVRTSNCMINVSICGIWDGIYEIRARHSGKSIEVANGSTSNGANVVQWSWNGGDHQRWDISHIGNGQFKILNVNSNKSLDIAYGSTADGANLQQYDYWGNSNQQFEITPVSGSYYRFAPVHSGKSLDVGGSHDGANVQQWSYWGGNNQQFQLISR